MHYIKSGPFIWERKCLSSVNSFRGVISLKKLDFENITFQGAAAGFRGNLVMGFKYIRLGYAFSFVDYMFHAF